VSRAPENLTYTLNVQRQVNKDTVLEVGYNFVRGTHLQAGLLNYNQLNFAALPGNLSPFTAAGRTLLNSAISSPAAQAAGPLRSPSRRSAITSAWRGLCVLSRSTARSIRRAATATAVVARPTMRLVLKLEKRYSSGLTFLTSYVFSKILTDADSAWVGGVAMDHYNRKLEYSIGQFDQTHNLKFSYV
jgi:hypothetical protein